MPCCPGKEINCPNFTEIYPWVRLILQYGSRQTALRVTSREEQWISHGSGHLGGCQSGISKKRQLAVHKSEPLTFHPITANPAEVTWRVAIHLNMNHMREVEGLAFVFLDLFGHNHLAIEANCQPPRGQLGMDVYLERAVESSPCCSPPSFASFQLNGNEES